MKFYSNVKVVNLGKVQLDQHCDEWLPEMCGLQNFGSTSRPHLPFCVCDLVPVAKNFKRFQMCVPSVNESVSLMVTSQSTDQASLK